VYNLFVKFKWKGIIMLKDRFKDLMLDTTFIDFLSASEIEIVKLSAEGESSNSIADALMVSPSEIHVKRAELIKSFNTSKQAPCKNQLKQAY
jgi:DNA-binding NarL/FixJ family response regulator